MKSETSQTNSSIKFKEKIRNNFLVPLPGINRVIWLIRVSQENHYDD